MSSTYLLIAMDKHNGDDSPQICQSDFLRTWEFVGLVSAAEVY